MLNKGQSLLLMHRENYIVPKGQERNVHCKIAKLDGGGNFIEKAKLIFVGVKMFETTMKENLETMGYTVEILYHPLGRYSNVVIKDKDVEMAIKDAEIERLKKELEEAKRATKEEKKDTEEVEEKKKVGRPKKEE